MFGKLRDRQIVDPVDGKSEGQGACKLQSNRTPVRAQMQASTSAAADLSKDESVPMKRVRRVVDRWVYGPNPKYQLEDGESELVTMAVWVRVPMW